MFRCKVISRDGGASVGPTYGPDYLALMFFEDRGSGANAGRHGSALKYRITAACRGARLWGSCALWHVRRVLKPYKQICVGT